MAAQQPTPAADERNRTMNSRIEQVAEKKLRNASRAAMWMSSHFGTRSPLNIFSSMFFNLRRPKRDCLLCVARHTAVALTWHAPLFKAQSPGLSVSSTEPSGVFLSRFWLSSSRSLGRCLLLGQRSRLNFLSYLIGSLFHQDYRDAHTEFSRHRYNGHPRSHMARMVRHTERKKSLSSPSWRIADQEAWMSLLRSHPSPV